MKFYTTLIATVFTFNLLSGEPNRQSPEEKPAGPSSIALKDEVISTHHSITINGVDTSYTATVGTQVLKDDKDAAKASIFFVEYIKDGVTDRSVRPVTFCFNGGPGSSSVWLHLGMLGPRRVNFDQQGIEPKEPYLLKDNPYSLLDETDLVFIDPVSTGFSRAANDPKEYHGVDGDVNSVAEFIRLYLSRRERWESPKFLAGESYGTTRAAGLAKELHDKYFVYLDGIVMVSTVLNFQTLDFTTGNDLPYMLYLPTYAAVAFYHNKLTNGSWKNKEELLEEVEHFSLGEYSQALMLGSRLGVDQRKVVVEKLSIYTGLSESYIERSNLRVPIFRFAKELLRDQKRVVGRFDGRVKGIDLDTCAETFFFDPSMENILGTFTATFNAYVRSELGYKKDEEYKILTSVQPWDYSPATNQYLDVAEKLKDVMSKNTALEVFVGSGYSDLATPYFATEYTFNHLELDASIEGNIVMKKYEGGHMMYLNEASLVELKGDLSRFYQGRLQKKGL